MKKYNFKAYYIKTSPKTTLKLNYDKNYKTLKVLNIYDNDVKKIKFLQANDFYYLYSNIFYEVFYSMPKVNSSDNYSYNMLILVTNDFDIKKISNHNFNLINIDSCVQLNKKDINYNFIKSFFEDRTILNNSSLMDGEYKYDYSDHNINHNNENLIYESQHKMNISSFQYIKKFNQNLYVQIQFRCLSGFILDFGKNYYIEQNKFGNAIMHDDLYEEIGCFFSNFGDLANIKVANINDETISFSNLLHYPCTVYENLNDLDIHSYSLSKEFVLNNFINFEDKEIRIKIGDKKTSIDNIII